MGCDIHMFIEYKVGDNPWFADKHHSVPKYEDDEYARQVDSTSRNYYLFGQLAGVRTAGPTPKGLPKDVTDLVKRTSDGYGTDGHSHSFIYLDDFAKVVKTNYDKYLHNNDFEPIAFYDDFRLNYSYPNLVAYLIKQKELLELDAESEKMILGQEFNTKVEVRLVFFFDN